MARIDGAGISEHQRSVAVVAHAVPLAYQLVAIEHDLLALLVEHECHALEASTFQRLVALEDVRSVTVFNDHRQMLVGTEPQLQIPALCAVREDGHGLIGFVWLDHHLDGDVLVAEIAVGLRAGIAVASELQRRGFLNGRLVGLAHHIEVGGGLQIVILYVFGEVEDDVAASP